MDSTAEGRPNGVVYTRRWVVDFVLDVAGYVPGTGIVDEVAVEPSCGEGAFLVAMADRLVDELAQTGRPWSDISGSIVAYDLDGASVSRSIETVAATLMARGCDDETARVIASGWVRCADFVLDDVPACDFVVGNPPYVRATDLPRKQREAYCKAMPSFSMGCDLYVAFFDHALDVLRSGGSLCYICADRWLQNAYGRGLRARIGSECDLVSLVRMHGVDAFDAEVDSYPAVTLVRKRRPEGMLAFVNCSADFGPADVPAVEAWLAHHDGDASAERFEAFDVARPKGDDVYPLGGSDLVRFVSRARVSLPSIEEAGVSIGIGIATGRDRVFITDDPDLVEPERMLPVFVMRDYRRGHPERRKWLVNPWNDDGTLVDLADWPRLAAYLHSHEDDLRSRAVARRHPEAWYRTIDKPRPGLMDRDILLMPDMATTSDPILSHGRYPAHACYWMASDIWDMHVLGGLVMADTTRRFVDALGVKMRGGTLRFQAQYLRLVHVPPYDGIRPDIRQGLSEAFDEGDRDAATKLAEAAYEEAMI